MQLQRLANLTLRFCQAGGDSGKLAVQCQSEGSLLENVSNWR